LSKSFFARSAEAVTGALGHPLPKQRVAGSSPVSRSRYDS
jgi:hypothetical protein